MVAQAKTIAQHLGAVPDAMQSVHARVRRRPASRRRRGDERPYTRRACTSPTSSSSCRSSRTARCEAFAVVIGHQTDMGGRVPGSNASDSTEIYQEGLRIPPMKLYERGVLEPVDAARSSRRTCGCRSACWATWARSTRRARWASASCGKLFARYGRQTLARLHRTSCLDYAGARHAAEIARWPRGTYRFTDHLDERRPQRRPRSAHGGHHRARRRPSHV